MSCRTLLQTPIVITGLENIQAICKKYYNDTFYRYEELVIYADNRVNKTEEILYLDDDIIELKLQDSDYFSLNEICYCRLSEIEKIEINYTYDELVVNTRRKILEQCETFFCRGNPTYEDVYIFRDYITSKKVKLLDIDNDKIIYETENFDGTTNWSSESIDKIVMIKQCLV